MAIVRRLQAIVDIEEISSYIADHNESAALRFLDHLESSFQFLEQFPRSGRVCRFRDPRLADVRKRVIPGFKKYLIYYRPITDGVEILRIIHGARDTDQMLGELFD
jgi:toxin ParE1/3/4